MCTQSRLAECEAVRPRQIPWRHIALSPPVWAITTAHVTQSFANYVLLTELPNYMNNVLNLDLKKNVCLMLWSS